MEAGSNFMIEMVFPQRCVNSPLYLTSANGKVLARCSTEPMTDRLFRAADLTTNPRALYLLLNRSRSTGIGGRHNR
jgi:hypothetical protein